MYFAFTLDRKYILFLLPSSRAFHGREVKVKINFMQVIINVKKKPSRLRKSERYTFQLAELLI